LFLRLKNTASILLLLLIFATIIVLSSCASWQKKKENLWTTASIGELYKAAPEGVKNPLGESRKPVRRKGEGRFNQ